MTDSSREAVADHLRQFSMTTLTEDIILALRAALATIAARLAPQPQHMRLI